VVAGSAEVDLEEDAAALVLLPELLLSLMSASPVFTSREVRTTPFLPEAQCLERVYTTKRE